MLDQGQMDLLLKDASEAFKQKEFTTAENHFADCLKLATSALNKTDLASLFYQAKATEGLGDVYLKKSRA